jgi:hypothetical protein
MEGRLLPSDPIPVRVFVPRKAMYDLGAMQEITAKVLGRLGCDNCHSGRRLFFEEFTNFAVHPESLEVDEFYGFPGR